MRCVNTGGGITLFLGLIVGSDQYAPPVLKRYSFHQYGGWVAPGVLATFVRTLKNTMSRKI